MNLEAMQTGAIQHRAAAIEVADRERSELTIRCVPYEVAMDIGPFVETFARGAFAKAAKAPHRLGVWHEHGGPLTGRGIEVVDDDDALILRAKLASTSAARDMVALLDDKLLTQASVEFIAQPDFMDVTRDPADRLHVRHRRAHLRGAAVVFEGAYGDEARVLAVRDDERDREVEEAQLWLQEYRARRS